MTVQTAIGFAIEPGRPDESLLIDMVSTRPGMPPVATAQVDAAAVELLQTWISKMRR